MIKLYSPENESELVVIKSIFQAEGVNYYVLNDHFGTLKVGPRIGLLNAKYIFVSEEDYDSAKEILLDFLANIRNGNEPFHSKYSIPDKVRMVIETLIFGWFMPGNRWVRPKIEDKSL
jgi:hypothetical protein